MLPSYFHEIGKIPLLTAEEEVQLAGRVQAGCEESRNRMIAANLRLVVRIAGEFGHLGLPQADVISEGNLGLVKAVERFRPQKGSKFSSYAAWWIRQAIQRAIGEQTLGFRLTPVATSKLAKLRRVAQGMAGELGREPTDEELAEELGLEASAVRHLKNIGARPASMDAPLSGEDGMTFGSLLVDEHADDPLAALTGKDLESVASELLASLKARERAILVRRFGLDGHPAATLEDIGRELGFTRERVRQIQDAALRRMRHTFRRRQALQFLRVLPRPAAALALQPSRAAA